jgi:hypothetical protein
MLARAKKIENRSAAVALGYFGNKLHQDPPHPALNDCDGRWRDRSPLRSIGSGSIAGSLRAGVRKSGVNMTGLYSRTALIIAACYAAVATGWAIYIWRIAEAGAVGFGFLFIGFPWSLAAIFTSCFSIKETYCLLLVFALNTATV